MSEWIKCSERMPEELQHVLASGFNFDLPTHGRWVEPSTFFEGSFRGFTHADDEVFVGDKDELHTPTHWQPLPAPPAE
ncbi:DUF551 domain-containing protein [Pseudomonas alliivorans]|nr:DUF551 domain-containing protein [Pseudomonas alliivorans]MEE4752853.1 DUF551 domain-containing protein [Pseudomonas alliivorans]